MKHPYSNIRLTLAATGDFICNMRLSCYDDADFLSVVEIIRKADVAYTNLETIIHNYEGYPAAEAGGTWQRSPSFVADELKWVGFDIVSCATNHACDYSYPSLFSTIAMLSSAGIVHAGIGGNLGEAREPKYLETSKGRVALISACSTFAGWNRAGDARRGVQGRPGINPLRFYYLVNSGTMDRLREICSELHLWSEESQDGKEIHFFRPGLSNTRWKFVVGNDPIMHTKCNELDLKGNIASVKDAKRQADYVFVSYHGHECMGLNRETPADFQVEFARACIDAGADVFLGHGPHTLRGIEMYRGKPVFYSLGNFVLHSSKVTRLPANFYETFGLGSESTPADGFEGRAKHSSYFSERGRARGVESRGSETVVASCVFDGGEVAEVGLCPVWLKGRPSSQMRFLRATGDKAKEIINHLSELSFPYGTRIEYQDEMGTIR